MRRKVDYRITGAGEPALVFVHGFGCAKEDWDGQTAALSRRFQCLALDLPGHGESERPREVTLAELAAAVNVARAREHLGDVILIGHSMGAKLVREAYAQRPDGVLGIVLIEGSLYLGGREELVERARGLVDRAGFAAFARGLFEDMFLEQSDPVERDRLIARAMAMDPDFGRALFLETVGWDLDRGRETLAAIEVPLLLLQSTYFDADFQRRPIPPGGTASFVERVGDLVPRARVSIIPDAGHFPMLDARDAVNAEIRAFAESVRAEATGAMGN